MFLTRTRDEWAKKLLPRETCATPVLSVGEALKSGWALESRMLVRSKGNGGVLNASVRGVPAPGRTRRARAPSLGEHTLAIMESLGYSKEQFVELKKGGVLQ